jgi:hypothetical protein
VEDEASKDQSMVRRDDSRAASPRNDDRRNDVVGFVCVWHCPFSLFCSQVSRFNPDTPEPIMLVQACELSSFGFFQ